MSSWVEELGQKKLTDKELKVIAKLFEIIAEIDEDGTDADDFNETVGKTIDTAIYNLGKLKEVIRLEK